MISINRTKLQTIIVQIKETSPRTNDSSQRLLANNISVLLDATHKALYYPSIKPAINLIQRFGKIPNLEQRLIEQKAKCQKCQQFLRINVKYKNIIDHVSTDRPFEDISTDMYGPIEPFFKERRELIKHIYSQ